MTFIIAELALGHEGKVDRLYDLVDVSIKAGADAVKFQVYKTEELMDSTHSDYDLFKSYEFNSTQWQEIIREISKEIKVWTDVFGKTSYNLVNKLPIDGIKIHSSDIFNVKILELVSHFKKKIMLGVGGSSLIEIKRALNILTRNEQKQIVLMTGIQLFPTSLISNNINIIKDLENNFGIPIGFSDHLSGDDKFATILPVLAVSKGAKIIEKHLTINRNFKWEDYHSALNPDEFLDMVHYIRNSELLLDAPLSYISTEDEKKYREATKKVLSNSCKVIKGQKITDDILDYKRIANIKNCANYFQIINRTASCEIEVNQQLVNSDVNSSVGLILIVRVASSRLNQKALLPFAGSTTIEFLITRLKSSKYAENIILCTSTNTEDDVFVEICKKQNIKLIRGDEKNIANRILKAIKEHDLDHIVRITGDDLLRDVAKIDEAVLAHTESNVDYTNMLGLPYGVDSEVFSANIIQDISNYAEDIENTEYLSWYVMNEDINSKYTLTYNYSEHYRLTLDTEEDYVLFQELYNNFGDKLVNTTTDELCEFLDKNENIANINSKTSVKLTSKDINTKLNFKIYKNE